MTTSIRYEVTPVDLEEAFEYELRTKYARTLRIRALWNGLGAFAIGWPLCFLLFHNHIAAASVAAVFAVVLLVTYPSVTRDQLRKAFRKQYRNASDSALGPHTLEFAGDGLVFEGSSATTRLAWSGIQEGIITPKHLFLYVGPNRAVIVPRSTIAEEDWAAISSQGTSALGAKWRAITA